MRGLSRGMLSTNSTSQPLRQAGAGPLPIQSPGSIRQDPASIRKSPRSIRQSSLLLLLLRLLSLPLKSLEFSSSTFPGLLTRTSPGGHRLGFAWALCGGPRLDLAWTLPRVLFLFDDILQQVPPPPPPAPSSLLLLRLPFSLAGAGSRGGIRE